MLDGRLGASAVPMAGKVRALIDDFIRLRTRGNPTAEPFVRAHLMLKGIDPDKHTAHTEDDEEKIAQLERMIEDFGASGL